MKKEDLKTEQILEDLISILSHNLDYDFSDLWDLLKPLYDKDVSVGEITYISIFVDRTAYIGGTSIFDYLAVLQSIGGYG